MIRMLILAVSAVTGAVTLGRRFADRSIDKALDTEIEAAKDRAVKELRSEIDAHVDWRLRSYALTLLVKSSLLAAPYLAFKAGLFDAGVFRIFVGMLITAFVSYDVAKAVPRAPLAWRLFRAYGLDAKTAFTEYVSRAAFARAYEEAQTRLKVGATRRVVAVSNYSADQLSARVGAAVAEVAAAASFAEVRRRVGVGAMKTLILLALYAGFIALLFQS